MNDYEYHYSVDPEQTYKLEHFKQECLLQRKWGIFFTLMGIALMTSNMFALLELGGPSTSSTLKSIIYAILGACFIFAGWLTIRASFQTVTVEVLEESRKSFILKATKIDIDISYMSSLYPLFNSVVGLVISIPAWIDIARYIADNTFVSSNPWPETVINALWLFPSLYILTLAFDYLKVTKHLKNYKACVPTNLVGSGAS